MKGRLYYFGARWYDPELGLWISPDPAHQFASPYAYGYAPNMGWDPNGLEWYNDWDDFKATVSSPKDAFLSFGGTLLMSGAGIGACIGTGGTFCAVGAYDSRYNSVGVAAGGIAGGNAYAGAGYVNFRSGDYAFGGLAFGPGAGKWAAMGYANGNWNTGDFNGQIYGGAGGYGGTQFGGTRRNGEWEGGAFQASMPANVMEGGSPTRPGSGQSSVDRSPKIVSQEIDPELPRLYQLEFEYGLRDARQMMLAGIASKEGWNDVAYHYSEVGSALNSSDNGYILAPGSGQVYITGNAFSGPINGLYATMRHERFHNNDPLYMRMYQTGNRRGSAVLEYGAWVDAGEYGRADPGLVSLQKDRYMMEIIGRGLWY